MSEPKRSKEWRLEPDDLRRLVSVKVNVGSLTKYILLFIGVLFTPFAAVGALIGFARGYNRFMRPKGEPPEFKGMPLIVKISMGMGAILFCLIMYGIFFLIRSWIESRHPYSSEDQQFLYALLLVNIALTGIAFFVFGIWRNGMRNLAIEETKFGTARFANPEELKPYQRPDGIYIGGGYAFADKGHILTVAGTRGGKGTNLIIPNLLGITQYHGSWVVIDPKGENAAITARFQRESGKQVVVLNPWGLLEDRIGQSQCYNPLDILSDNTSIHLVDDVQVVAEMLVPMNPAEPDKFFTDCARAVIAGLLLHLVTSQEKEKRTLKTLWQWVRLAGDDWNTLLIEMAGNPDPVNGEVVGNAANEIVKLQAAGDDTFGSIMATVLQCTDFLKSQALQQSMTSGLDPYTLADGNTTLYVIIPADKLQSHSRWLRLVTTTLMRAVVRKPKKRVTFLLDEFAALGYISEIEVALSTYAGYEVTVWPVLQSLIQLQNNYGKGWETFIGNTAVKQYFSINDNFTADYVSKAIGTTSNVVYTKRWFRIEKIESNPRPLITPDELRRESGKDIFIFIQSIPVSSQNKIPYYNIPNIVSRSQKNPYH